MEKKAEYFLFLSLATEIFLYFLNLKKGNILDVKKTRNLQRQAAQSLVNQKILNSTWRESPPSRELLLNCDTCRYRSQATCEGDIFISRIRAIFFFSKTLHFRGNRGR